MNGRKKIVMLAAVLAVLLVVVLAAAAVYRYLAPSSEKKELKDIFALAADEVALIIDDEEQEAVGFREGKTIYVPVETASRYMDERIYLDESEALLSYATEDGVIRAEADETAYRIGKKRREASVPILKKKEGAFYVSLEFIEQHASCDIKQYENPDRLAVMSDRDKEHVVGTMAEDTRIRTGPNKKYAYITEVSEGTKVFLEEDIPEENEYVAVTTPDGVGGYVPKSSIAAKEKTVWQFAKSPVSFEPIHLREKVCLGWHQVTNEESSAVLSSSVSQAKAMNVISPTWFSLRDNKGNFNSLANSGYVSQAHAAGLQVWGLINDFSNDINLQKILGSSENRDRLVNSLVAAAIQYDLDGINIDFENITENTADAYLEFLRELVLKCHANDLIVSVDNYTPKEYNAHYNLEEQGRIVDYVILMAYDEHWAGCEESGSVSSLGFVEQGVKDMTAKVPADRVVAALPFYTRLWKEVKTKSGVEVSSTAYGMSGAESVLSANGAVPDWDDKTGQYYAQFKADGAVCKIWLEEETSLQKKMEVLKKYKTAGVAFWKLGLERAVTWSTIENIWK